MTRRLDNAAWRKRANCLGVDPSVFYPERGVNAHAALRICGRCEVQHECLDDALTNGEFFGVHGGRTEQEKRKLRRARNRMESVA